MELVPTPTAPDASGDTPAMRLFGLLETIVAQDRPVSLPGMVEATGLPKPTVHRMLQQLEQAGLLQRESHGRSYAVGVRLRRLAETLLLNDSLHGARHAVLRSLVEEVGESCNITALAGGEVVYLDRVETAAPLRFYLHPGSRVPVHCSASGKLFLSEMSARQRRRLLEAAPLASYTANTLTDPALLEAQLAQVRRDRHAQDNEEFLPGLFCVAVPVPHANGRSSLSVAVQAPVIRLGPDKVAQVLPALRRAAEALGRIEAGATASTHAANE
jgi:IclR family acetate operon transcriptional repressor